MNQNKQKANKNLKNIFSFAHDIKWHTFAALLNSILTSLNEYTCIHYLVYL